MAKYRIKKKTDKVGLVSWSAYEIIDGEENYVCKTASVNGAEECEELLKLAIAPDTYKEEVVKELEL